MGIFISHASKDKPLVDAFVDLLQTGIDIRQQDIFCTSLEGLGIPTGSNFVAFIKSKLGSAAFVVSLISPQYYESLFCQCELGATWVTSKDFFPLLVPPIDYAQLTAVLQPSQAAMITDPTKLDELYDRVVKAGFGKANTGRWISKRDAFLKGLPRILKDLKGSTVVLIKTHTDLKAAYDAAQETIAEKDEEIGKLRTQMAAIEKLKDVKEVRKIKASADSNEAQFKMLAADIRGLNRDLPNAVVEAIYHSTIGTSWNPDLGFGMDQLREEVEKAEQRGLISSLSGGYEPVSGHPNSPLIKTSF